MRQTIQFIKENYGGFAFNCKQYDQLYELMKHDKKNTAGAINFTLLKEVGDICLRLPTKIPFTNVRFLSGMHGDHNLTVYLYYFPFHTSATLYS